MPGSQLRVLLLENIHPVAQAHFASMGAEVICNAGALQHKDLHEALQGINVLGIRSKTQLTKEVLQEAKDLLCIGCFCIGTNQVDLKFARGRGIPVFNAPFSNTRSVAELIVAEVIMLARRLADSVRQLHNHQWQKSAAGCYEIRGKTLGVIGYGHIGSQLGVLAEAMGMRVVFFDIAKKLPMGNNSSLGSMEELLAISDFVTLHVPATPETANMFREEQMSQMKPGSFLLNASRGTVVDLDALAARLRSGQIAGAAVDVYPSEPRTNGEGFQSPLIGLPNVVLTPHIGGSTEEAQESIGVEVSSACTSYATDGNTSTAVEFPQVNLARRPGSYRILNAHRNVPGVMANMLRILSDLEANIHAQHLATYDDVGYLVTDVDKDIAEDARKAISELPTSIKTRILSEL